VMCPPNGSWSTCTAWRISPPFAGQIIAHTINIIITRGSSRFTVHQAAIARCRLGHHQTIHTSNSKTRCFMLRFKTQPLHSATDTCTVPCCFHAGHKAMRQQAHSCPPGAPLHDGILMTQGLPERTSSFQNHHQPPLLACRTTQ
jgi:hypothetical protein